MNQKTALAFENMKADMEREFAPMLAKRKLTQRRKNILEAINNEPNDYRIAYSFEGFLMCFPKYRMRFLLKLKERVIYRRVSCNTH